MNSRFLLSIVALALCVASTVEAQNTKIALKAGDRIVLSIRGIPAEDASQISKVYDISDGGTINLMNVGEVKAAGFKPSELQRVIEQTYIKHEVYMFPTVTVWDARAGLIYVTHVGRKNFPRPYNPSMTLLKTIAMTGRFSFRGNGPIKLIRNGVTTEFKDKDLGRDPSRNFKLQPDDQIIVPD
ncbi:polysaccharide biosynthesis/export family protein [Prosthecobacter sp.]|jgi:polysaccharide export outer membrane protein|uniref:polysaccharide biosynthesis/export family protein n=1 Tax=Prosthecobacter sp. TaxID=1965333 RepID=UPI0037CC04C2